MKQVPYICFMHNTALRLWIKKNAACKEYESYKHVAGQGTELNCAKCKIE
jgi:hypothetical protein